MAKLSLSALRSLASKSRTTWTQETEEGVEARVQMVGVAKGRTLADRADYLRTVNPECKVTAPAADGPGISKSKEQYTVAGAELADFVHQSADTAKPVNRVAAVASANGK
jgi:hypothetical protein